jgi:predicted PurR-regulated permease PerM
VTMSNLSSSQDTRSQPEDDQHGEVVVDERAAIYVEDEPARRDEERLLSEVGVDPEDPELDAAIRALEAGASDDLPFGTPGPPMGRRAPMMTGAAVTVGVLAVLLLAWGAYIVADVLVVVLVAGFLATGLDPAVRWIQERTGAPRGAAVAVVVLTLATLLATFGVFGVPGLVTQANELRQDAPQYAEQLRDAYPVLADLDQRMHWVDLVKRGASDSAMTPARDGLLNLARGVLHAVIATITCIVLTIYFLARFPSLKRSGYRLIPRSRRARAGLLIDEILERIGGYVLGNLVTSAVAGIASYVVLQALGVPHALPLALFVALTDMIPLIGASLGAALSSAVALTVSVPAGLIALAFFFVYQQFENIILVPHVMRRTVNVSPVGTIVAILIGAALLGVLGAMLAVPVAAAVQLIATAVWVPRQEAL